MDKMVKPRSKNLSVTSLLGSHKNHKNPNPKNPYLPDRTDKSDRRSLLLSDFPVPEKISPSHQFLQDLNQF
jgi:hypothetical protein